MKIVLVAAVPLFIALQAAGVLLELHNAALIDVGTSVAALGISLGWLLLR